MNKDFDLGDKLVLDKIKKVFLEHGLIDFITSPLEILEFSNGYSNLTYQLNIEEKEFVLRRPPKGAVKRGHDMGREYKVLSHLAKGTAKIAPSVFFFQENSDIIGAPFYVMEKINGIILTSKEAKKRHLDSKAFASIFDTWLTTFVQLHKVEYKRIGLGELGRPNGYVERQVENWGKQYLKAATMKIPEALNVMRWMQENQPKEYEHTFIHNDFKYDNVVFENERWSSISAVLDWEMCTLGDPMMDFGTSLAYWMRPSDGLATSIIPSPTLFDGNPERSDIVEKYALKSNRNVDNIVFYYVFGLFKIAVIVQQIFYRYNKGLTKNPKFAQLDKACKLFCTMAWQAAQKNQIEKFM